MEAQQKTWKVSLHYTLQEYYRREASKLHKSYYFRYELLAQF